MTVSNKRQGFTLVELLVAISIVAILGTIGFTTYSQSQLRGRDLKRKQDLRAIATGLELFYQQYQRFPCSGTTGTSWDVSASGGNWLVDDHNCYTSGVPSDIALAPTYINEMPSDPMSDTSGSPGGANWVGYAYYSTTTAQGSCTQGHYYLLTTQLENPNDPDRLNNTSTQVCGAAFNTGLRNNSFVISAP